MTVVLGAVTFEIVDALVGRIELLRCLSISVQTTAATADCDLASTQNYTVDLGVTPIALTTL